MSGSVPDQRSGQPDSDSMAVPASAGSQLRAIREAAQLSVDDVAQQLKLARRQVVAIENDDLDALPGPTFVRGFIRNYARLLRIDAAPLLEASGLAAASAVPIQQLAPTMGELPLDKSSGMAWTRWLIPSGLLLVLIVGIAYYEFSNVTAPGRKANKDAAEVVVAPLVIAPESTEKDSIASTTAPGGPTGAGAALSQQVVPVSPAVQSAPNAITESGRIELEFAGPSWVEVRDSRGEILLSRTMSSGNRQSLSGKMPLALRIGNASVVRLKFDGTSVDLAPHTRSEIARLTLPLQRP